MVKLHNIVKSEIDPTAHIVFVHGISGHAINTWCHDENAPRNSWPIWMGEDLQNTWIWTLEYESPKTSWLGNTLDIEDRAKTISVHFLEEKSIHTAPIYFITHSLGGLIIKELILKLSKDENRFSPVLFRRIKGIVFIGTPHYGSVYATFSRWFFLAFYPSAIAVQLALNSRKLTTLASNFRNLRQRPECLVFFETKPLPFMFTTLVGRESSDPKLENVDFIPIERNHSSICKPKSKDDDLYKSTMSFIKNKIKAKYRGQKKYKIKIKIPKNINKSENYFRFTILKIFLLTLIIYVFFYY